MYVNLEAIVCKARLLRWSKNRNPEFDIQRIRKRLVEIRRGRLTMEARTEYDRLERELEILYHDQDMYWKQRGKVAWMKDGDKNTSFLHAKASIRESVNTIDGIRNGVGQWVTEKEQMEAVVQVYFQGLFRSANPNEGEMDEVLSALESRISEDESQAFFSLSPIKRY